MSHRVTTVSIVCALGLLGGPVSSAQRADRGLAAGAFTEIATPAASGAAEPNLAVDRRGRPWLSWLEPRPAGGHAFRASAWSGTTFGPPITIAEGTNFLANWADFPAMFFAQDGTIAAHWLERAGSRAAYGIRMKTSTDGVRWSAPLTPHRDASPVEHGFVSFFDAPGGGVGVVWLDGREMAPNGPGGHGSGNMTLRATTVKGGALGEEMLLDPRVCDCCQTAAARTADGIVVAYRDRSTPEPGQTEIRDIAVVRFEGGSWSKPTTVREDRWELTGCPVNGPAIAASGRRVVVAWFTDAGREPRVQAAFSEDAGRTFGTPARLDTAVTLGRMSVAMAAADRAFVSFIERTETGGRLVVREVRPGGVVGDPVTVAAVSRDRASGFPQLAMAGGRLFVAWTDIQPNTPPRVRVAAARVD